jgi:hypothetical protein
MAGDVYARTSDLFEMPRGRLALDTTLRELPREPKP